MEPEDSVTIIKKVLPLDPTLSQLNPVLILTTHLYKRNINIKTHPPIYSFFSKVIQPKLLLAIFVSALNV
jgi:hypothetical protein